MVTRALRATGALGVLAGLVLSVAAGWVTQPAVAATGINKQINFQGKVVNSNGTNVADGNYTFVFRLYTVSSGGSHVWTDTETLAVADGIFQYALGSDTTNAPLPGSVDFNTDNIYLGINFNGDGEMTPRIHFTASAYAFNSDLLDGLDASAFAQLNPSSAQSGSLNVTGSVQAGTSLQSPLVDTATGVAMNIGTGTATSVTIGRTTSSNAVTIQGSAASAWTVTGASGTTSLVFAAPSGSTTLTFPTGTGTICTTVAATCSATYQAAGSYLAKNAADTSSASISASNFLYGFTNSNGTPTTGGVLQLDNSANTGSTLRVTTSGNAASGQALISATNTAGSPSGNLIDLRVTAGSRFSVDAAGAVTTSSTINGQTISSTASFTGTVAVATSVAAPLVQTADATGATTALTVRTGNSTSSGNTGALTIKSGDATSGNSGAVSLDSGTASGTAGSVSVGTGAFAHSTTVGSTTGASGLTLQAGSSGITMTGNTTLTGTLTVDASTDITTGSGQDLTMVANGAGQIILNDTTQVSTLGAADASPVYLCYNASSQLASCSTTGTGTAFVQGGNTFSSTTAGDLGTNNNGVLNFRTNNATRLTLSTVGDLQFAQGGNRTVNIAQVSSAGVGNNLTIAAGQGNGANNGGELVLQGGARGSSGNTGSVVVRANGTDSLTAFVVQNSSSSPILRVDTTNARVGINTASDPASTLEVTGTLRLSGTSVENFTTPGGGTVTTKINIPIFNPGASGQILAFGLPSGSATNSRAISVFDDRAAADNQPPLAVLSPNQNDIMGLSWDGQNTNAFFKTTSSALGFKVAGTTSATMSASQIDLLQNTAVAANRNLTMSSGTGTFAQTYTGTGDAHTITANSLQTGAALKVTSANNTAANTSWSAVSLNPTNSQGSTAVTGSNLISGLDVQFTQAATVASNNETVANLAVAANGGSPTDSTVQSILNLANNDTATGNQITVTDALRVNGANVTNGINFNGTFGTNLISSSTNNFIVTQGGAGTLATSILTPLHATADSGAANTAAVVFRSGNVTGGGFNSGNVTVDVGSESGAGFAGNLYLGDTNAASINIGRNSTSNVALTVAATAATSSLIFSNAANTFATTITVTTPTAARAINFPNLSGEICLDSGNCGGATGYILNQNSIDQTADFRISGTGRANTSILTPTLDTATGVALNIGAGTPTTTQINLNQNVSVASGKTVTIQGNTTQSNGTYSFTGNGGSSLTTSSGALTITSAAAATWSAGGALQISTSSGDLSMYATGNLNIGNTGSANINIGTSAATHTIGIGTDATTVQTVSIGSTNSTSTTTLNAGSGTLLFNTATAQFTESASARTLTVAARSSNAAGTSLVVAAGAGGSGASANAGGDLTLRGGAGAGTDGNGGNVIISGGAKNGSGAGGSVIVRPQASNDSTTAFDVRTAGDTSQFLVDTTNTRVITQGLTIEDNSIATNAAMTVGSTNQTLTMQGGPSTKLTATNAGATATVTVNFATITQTGTYQFASPTSNTTYTICTTDTASCGGASGVYLRKNVANETSSANLSNASDYLYRFANSGGSVGSDVLQIDGGNASGSALRVTASSNASASNALIYARLTNASVGGNLLDLWSGASGSETSKFSVSAAGAVSTASTINGQTISSTASFTGTVQTAGLLTAASLSVTGAASLNSGATVSGAVLTVSNAASITGGINNNAGGITGTGAVSGVSSIQFNTAGGIDANAAVALTFGNTTASALTIGRTTGTTPTVSIQGNSSTTLEAGDGTNSVTVGFSGTPSSDIIYQFSHTASNGTYQICTTYAATCGTTYAAYVANGYVQLAPASVQNDANTAPSIHINKTTVTTNYLLRLQANNVDVFGVQANGIVTAAGQMYLGGTSGSHVAQIDTANFKLRVGTGTPTLGSGGANSTAAFYVSGASEFAGSIRVGDGTNNATFDGTTKEVTFTGTARHSKTIKLTAEYAGAVLDADGSNNTGTMTAALDTSTNPDVGYYRWTTGQSTSQDYDVVATVPVPEDWGAWNGNPTIMIYESASGGSFTATITRTDGTNDTNWGAITINPSGVGSWTTYSSTAIQSTGYTAGGIMVVRIKMTAPQNEHVRLGTITFPYLSKW